MVRSQIAPIVPAPGDGPSPHHFMELQLPSTITITIAEKQEVAERYRGIIHTLIAERAFNIKNGYVNLHFDENGTLHSIEVHKKLWRRKKVKLT